MFMVGYVVRILNSMNTCNLPSRHLFMQSQMPHSVTIIKA